MFPKLDDTTRRSRLATLGLGAAVAATFVMTQGGPAKAGDNPPPGLLAKIQIATQAFNRTPPTFVRAPATQRVVVVRRMVRGR